MTPWSKLDTILLSLLRKMLSPNPTNRLTLQKVRDHKWILMQFSSSGIEPKRVEFDLYFFIYSENVFLLLHYSLCSIRYLVTLS